MGDCIPRKAKSLKEQCIDYLEERIISGDFPSGHRLPSERALADMLRVSRPVVHESVVELSSRGLITILPRRGCIVNDFRTTGSSELLSSLFRYAGGSLRPDILSGMAEMRLLFETEMARLAALRRSSEGIVRLKAALRQEVKAAESLDWRGKVIAEADYAFHHAIALAGENIVYQMLMNSFRTLFLNVLSRFYGKRFDLRPILDKHRALLANIVEGKGEEAAWEMKGLLTMNKAV